MRHGRPALGGLPCGRRTSPPLRGRRRGAAPTDDGARADRRGHHAGGDAPDRLDAVERPPDRDVRANPHPHHAVRPTGQGGWRRHRYRLARPDRERHDAEPVQYRPADRERDGQGRGSQGLRGTRAADRYGRPRDHESALHALHRPGRRESWRAGPSVRWLCQQRGRTARDVQGAGTNPRSAIATSRTRQRGARIQLHRPRSPEAETGWCARSRAPAHCGTGFFLGGGAQTAGK